MIDRLNAVPAVLLMLAAFLAVTLIASLAGAANTGTAMTFGELAFAATLVWVLVRR
ncbi:MAG: hypothetical protein JWM31_1152 [Solirubrobacterales bacterium]|nr:hypothetical protein [Solirubrobacterales bacterium]